jgi:prepilin-type N-terminal cleavage/methylation domain-containing protein
MSHRRGYSLLETLFAISLLGVFLLIASRVIVANFDTTRATLLADGNTSRFDRAVIALRADVVNSSSVEMPEPTLLRIHGPGNQTIEWRTDHNSLSRIASTDKRGWDVGQSLNLRLDGPVVLLSDGSDQVAMTSIHAGGGR